MTPKVQKRAAAVVVHRRADDTSLPETGASGKVGADAKTGAETPRSPNPWPAEFGWDFPFDFPRPTR
jgi:hypothetical protein